MPLHSGGGRGWLFASGKQKINGHPLNPKVVECVLWMYMGSGRDRVTCKVRERWYNLFTTHHVAGGEFVQRNAAPHVVAIAILMHPQ